jgi:catecholate siderophore receptor
VSTVGGKTPQAVRDIPQTVTVVNKALLDAQGASSLADALRIVPGITLGGAEGGQIGNNINLRGFSVRTDIYRDGMRDRSQYYRDTFSLESVEVLKGPSSMLFGRGSTGGVINMVEKQANLTRAGEVSMSAGSAGQLRSTLDLNQPLSETAALRVSAFGQKQKTADRDVMQNEDYGVAPTLRFGIGSPTEVTLSALVQHNRDMPDYGQPAVNGRPAPVAGDKVYGMSSDHTIQDVNQLGAKIEHKFSPALTLRNQTRYGETTTDVRETAPGSVYAGSTKLDSNKGNPTASLLSALTVQLDSKDRYVQDRSFDNQTDLVSHFATGSIRHELIGGLEVGHDSYSNQAYTRTLGKVSLLDPLYASNTASSVTGNKTNSSADSVALYVNDTATLTSQWKAVAGVRRNRYSATVDNSVPSATVPRHAEQTVSFTSVRGGLIYQPADSQSYYLSYSTSFNPSLEALTATAGQQNLDPETNRSYEVGAKWDPNEDLSFNAALFQTDKDNARTKVSDGVYTLDGKVRVRGFELGASGRLSKRWQVFAGYTYLDGKVLQASATDTTQASGNTLGNTPRHTATVWTTYDLTRNWEVGGGALYMSERYTSSADTVKVGGFTRLDATVAYHQPKYEIRLNVLNLANRAYYDGLQGTRAIPAAGRTALLTGTYRF